MWTTKIDPIQSKLKDKIIEAMASHAYEWKIVQMAIHFAVLFA
jgi:hypothetical protein